MRIISFIFLSVLLFPALAGAQGHNTYCNMADSTAATQSCLKKHLDAAQQRLNKIYNNLETKLESDEKKQELKALQTLWLEYRDAECAWESEQTETASLKRINELSCMARVTDDRADLLTVIVMDDDLDGAVREYGSFTRWMNVLAKDYPLVYWDYGKRFAEDLNCDNEPEQIMSGLKIKEDADRVSQEVIIAVMQYPATGRPKPTIFRFNVSNESPEDSVCQRQISLKKGENEKEEGDETCTTFLEIKHGSCESRKINWDGKSFELEPLPVPDEEIEEEEKE